MPFGLRIAMGALLLIVLLFVMMAAFCFSQPGAEEESGGTAGVTASP